MSRHSLNSGAGINDVGNGVTLRSDVHACLDRGGFVFYPTEHGGFMGYIVNIEEWNYVEVLHRREVNMHDRVVGEFLYARFAYNIIQQLPSFWRSLDSVPIPQAISDARKRRLQAEKQNDEDSVDSELETDHEHGCEDGASFP